MDPHSPDTPDGGGVTPQRAHVRDARVAPRGVLPRQIQTWLMVGLALVIVSIILITGHPEAPGRPSVRTGPADPALPEPDRIRGFEQQLAAEEARQQDARTRDSAVGRTATSPAGASMRTTDVLTSEQQRREYESLFADNIAVSRRPRDQQPSAARPQPSASASSAALSSDEFALLERALAQVPTPNPATRVPIAAPVSVAPMAAGPPTAPAPDTAVAQTTITEHPAAGPRLPVLEGTVIEGVLLNRLDGTFAGPVACLVTTPVYSLDRQTVLIPAGARMLGTAAPVQTWGDSRLAVSFHRLVMPDGHSYTLQQFKGLNQIGETGLRDRVNRHYLQVFGASLAIGALSGLAQYQTRGGLGAEFGDEYRQTLGSSLATSTSRVLDRYLNVLPTVTIREGYRLKVYLTNDLQLPAYAGAAGGIR